MAARGDEAAGRIESSIRESIERMIAELRTSIEDVREAVDQQLLAALQSVQADVNSLSFGSMLKNELTSLEDGIKAEIPPPPEPAPAPSPVIIADSSAIKAAIQAVEHGRNQVDVLNSMLEQCLRFGSRAALLILKGESFAGWKGAGFTSHGGSDEAVKRFSVTATTIPELERVIRDEQVIAVTGNSLSAPLGAGDPIRGLLVPMMIKDKVSAVVYVDVVAGEVDRFDPASVQLLVFTTGLLVDTLAIRKKVPSPALLTSSETDAKLSSVDVVAVEAEVEPEPAPAPPPAPKPEPPPSAWPSQPADETIAIPGRTFSFGAPPAPEPKPTPPASAYATTVVPALGAQPKPAADEGRPSTQYVPPAGVGRGGVLGGPQNEEARRHEEARRFARLLVSEIKLYNEAKVEQGRKNRDLYERLKEDIDRSRQMYDERIPEDVRKVSNYFYDELVRILADGNADAMGL